MEEAKPNEEIKNVVNSNESDDTDENESYDENSDKVKDEEVNPSKVKDDEDRPSNEVKDDEDKPSNEVKDIIPEYLCEICFEVSYEPQNMSGCGHTFCIICTEEIKGKPCPKCKRVIKKAHKSFALSSVISRFYPDQYKERAAEWLIISTKREIERIKELHGFVISMPNNELNDDRLLKLLRLLNNVHEQFTVKNEVFDTTNEIIRQIMIQLPFIKTALFMSGLSHCVRGVRPVQSIIINSRKHDYSYLLVLSN